MKIYVFHVPLTDRGMHDSRGGGVDFSKEAVRAAIAAAFETSLEESGVTDDLGYGFHTIGGGVDRFLIFGFSKLAASALKAGDFPLTLTRSELEDTLLERCDFSGTLDLPPCEIGTLRFGF